MVDIGAEAPSPEFVALLEPVVDDMRSNLDTLAQRYVRIVVEHDPGLGDDAVMFDVIRRAARANLSDVVDLLSGSRLRYEAPPENLALATALAQRDHPASTLIQGTRNGQRPFIEDLLRSFAGLTSDAGLLSEVTIWAHERVLTYLDSVLARMIDELASERRRWEGTPEARRWRTIRAILDGRLTDEAKAAQRLGHALTFEQLAMIVYCEEQPQGQSDSGANWLDDVARELARMLGAASYFTVPAGPGELYAWVSVKENPKVEALKQLGMPAGVGAAIGMAARGLEGFRRSHQQAQWALQIARQLRDPARVVSYQAVSGMSLLRDDPGQVRQFIALQLGGLAALDHGAARLRQTVLVALEEGMNASRAAKRLHMHRNTALYQLRSAEDLRGRPLDEQRFELELALRIVELFGNELLLPASGTGAR